MSVRRCLVLAAVVHTSGGMGHLLGEEPHQLRLVYRQPCRNGIDLLITASRMSTRVGNRISVNAIKFFLSPHVI